MPKSKNKKISKKSASVSVSKREPMTKFKFVITVLWGAVAVQIFILIFTIYAVVIFLGSVRI